MPQKPKGPERRLNIIWGARALAGYIFSDPEKWKGSTR